MSQRKGGRFSYLAAGGQKPEAPAEQRPKRTEQDGPGELQTPGRNGETGSKRRKAGRRGAEGGKEGTSTERASTARKSEAEVQQAQPTDLRTVPKGEGRMKQDRSQLNVRIPTALKRQASAKATLEGRDIGGIVEELLQEYVSG